MDLDRLKDLIKKYRENMKYYHDADCNIKLNMQIE